MSFIRGRRYVDWVENREWRVKYVRFYVQIVSSYLNTEKVGRFGFVNCQGQG